MIRYSLIDSPVDELLVAADENAIVALQMVTHRGQPRTIDPSWVRDDDGPLLADAAAQFSDYFAGKRRTFDLPLRPLGTDFQKRVWAALLEIPFGQTQSYGALATRVGDAGAFRAVGLANGRNPIAILIPCHRVIGADGSLTGFGGGIERKRFLLEMEGAIGRVERLFA